MPLYHQEPFLSFSKEIVEFSMPNEKKIKNKKSRKE